MKEDDEGRIENALQHAAGGEPSDAASWEAAITYFQRLALRTAHRLSHPLSAEEARETALDFIVDPDGLGGQLSARDARNRFISWLHRRWETTIRTEPLAEDRYADAGESLIVPVPRRELEKAQRRREALAERWEKNPAVAWLELYGGEGIWILYKAIESGQAADRSPEEIFLHTLRCLAQTPGARPLLFPDMDDILAAKFQTLLGAEGFKQRELAAIFGISVKRAERLAEKARRKALTAEEREKVKARAEFVAASPGSWAHTDLSLQLNTTTAHNRLENLLLASITLDPSLKPHKNPTGDTQRRDFSHEPRGRPGGRPGGARRSGGGLPRKNEKNRGKRGAYRDRGEK